MLRIRKQKKSNKNLSRGNLFFIAAVLCFFVQGNCRAAMKSSNYKIDADVIGGAGNTSTSANYSLGDTLGEPVIGEGASANFKTGAGFWYMVASQTEPLSLACEAEDVYMTDYTLGSTDNFNTYLFSVDQECVVTDNTGASWNFSMQSTDMTSTPHNTIPDENVKLSSNGVIDSPPTVTSPTLNVKETNEVGGDYPLNISQDIISGDASASGDYNIRPSVKLIELNSLYNESTSGTLTLTVQ